MTESNGTLIKMEGVKKVFYTDEVETHALSEIHLEIQKGQYISIAGPSAAANPRCSPFSACWIRPPTGITGSTASRFRS